MQSDPLTQLMLRSGAEVFMNLSFLRAFQKLSLLLPWEFIVMAVKEAPVAAYAPFTQVLPHFVIHAFYESGKELKTFETDILNDGNLPWEER